MTTDNFCFYLQYGLIQTSQTGGQRYSDTSPLSIFPWQRVGYALSHLAQYQKGYISLSTGERRYPLPGNVEDRRCIRAGSPVRLSGRRGGELRRGPHRRRAGANVIRLFCP